MNSNFSSADGIKSIAVLSERKIEKKGTHTWRAPYKPARRTGADDVRHIEHLVKLLVARLGEDGMVVALVVYFRNLLFGFGALDRSFGSL